MFGLLKNEFEKMIFRRKLLITFLCLTLLAGFISFGIYKSKEAQKKYSDPKFMIENLTQDINRMKAERDSTSGNDNKAKEDYNRMISDMEKQLEELNLQLNAQKLDWRESLTQENKRLEESKNMNDRPDAENQLTYINNQIERNKYFLEHNIKPKDSFNVNGYDLTIELISILGSFFIILITALLSADIVSGEYTPPTMKILLTRPVSRTKILLSKYITAIVSAVMVVISVELLVFLVTGLIFGFGDGAYPAFVGTRYKYNPIKSAELGNQIIQIAGSTYIIPLWKYFIKILAMQVIYIASAVSFFFLLSTVLKSSMISMAVGILISISLFLITQTGYLSKISPYIFVVYGDTPNIITGEIARRVNNPITSPTFAIITLLIWAIICYGISHLVFRKKDILI